MLENEEDFENLLEYGLLDEYCALLACNEEEIVKVVLIDIALFGIKNIFNPEKKNKILEKIKEFNIFCLLLEFQHHPNEDIIRWANRVLSLLIH